MAYITLDELKKMTDEQLYERWRVAGVSWNFPFDSAKCHSCVTEHGYSGCSHTEFQVQAERISMEELRNPNEIGVALRANLDEIYALRLFYRDLYANNPPELDEIPVVKEKETVVEN